MTRIGAVVFVVLALAGPARGETRVEGTMGFVLTTSMDEPDDDDFDDHGPDQDAGFLTGVTLTTSAGTIGRIGAAFHSTMYSEGAEVYHLGAVAGITPSWTRNFRFVLAVEAGVASFHDLGEDDEYGVDITVTGGEIRALFPYAGVRLGFEHDLFAEGNVAIGLWMHVRGDLGEETHWIERRRCPADAACVMEDAELEVGGMHAGLFVLTLSMRL